MERYNNTIQDSNGDIITTASVTVYLSLSGAVASIFADNETTALNNPFTVSDSNYNTDGSFWFKAANTLYDIKVTNNAVDTWVYDVALFDYDDNQPASHVADNVPINIGSSNDLTLKHNGTNSFIDNNTGDLNIRELSDSSLIIISSNDSTGALQAGITVGGATTLVAMGYDGTDVLNTNPNGIAMASGKGIDFGTSVLDDYEEGSWTPTGATGFDPSGLPSTITATYTKIGNTCTAKAIFNAYNNATNLQIGGLPFTSSQNSAFSISISTGKTFNNERVSGASLYCTISGTEASLRTWYIEVTYNI